MTDVFAPAKVNLFLHITGKHAGYHTLQTMCFFPSIGDRLVVSQLPSTASEDVLETSGDFAYQLPKDPQQNLLLKMLHHLRQRRKLPYYHIHLQKKLPVAAGLGGGSADAGALLRVISRSQNIDFADEPWRSDLASLGSDISACYLASPLLAEGIGDEIHPWHQTPDFAVLLANPSIPLSTAAVYQNSSQFSSSSLINCPKSRSGWLSLIKTSRNDLQSTAIHMVPEVQHMIDALEATECCIAARMSGSGASCFALYNTLAEAQVAEIALQKAHPNWWLATGKMEHGAKA